ncbi:MAG: TonB-dependent receptor, partial [Alphaproteobacteria bacterium]
HVAILPVDDVNGEIAQILIPQALGMLLDPATAAILGPLAQPNGAESADLGFDQQSTSYAAFGQANWHLTEDLTLVVGARYTMEEKEVAQFQVLNGPGIITQGVAGWEAYEFADTRNEYSFSPKLALQYRMDEDLMFYGSVAKGFKGGGYNASASKNAELEYQPENALAYEVGMKSEFLDGAARANISVFYTEFSDLQVSVFTTTQFVVRNAADAITQGVEFEFMMVPMEGLMLMASGAYTDAHFVSYKQGTCTVENGGDFCDLTGQTLQRAPEWTGNFSVSYLNPLGSMPFDLVTGVDLLYQDDFFLADDGDPLDAQEAYLQVNARIGLRADDESWSFMVFGRNLTDEVVKVTAADAPLADFSHFAVIEPPRLISAEFTVRF